MNIIYSKKQYEYIDYNNNGTVNFIQEANNFLKVYRRKITFKYDIEKDNKMIAKNEALNSQLFNNNGGDANNYDNYSIWNAYSNPKLKFKEAMKELESLYGND